MYREIEHYSSDTSIIRTLGKISNNNFLWHLLLILFNCLSLALRSLEKNKSPDNILSTTYRDS